MSWELVSFLILGAVLLGGFAWYERSRPPAQVVALVAALAALAIAGRIAFAAFPNVKPTTDIIVFAGFALGAAPGFAVGALTALVSNFWFGQGPWTPWQMAGWGMCGVLGALLALGVRNAGRLTLAATCGFAGIAYGALLNFSLMATYGGELSWERFGVISARAIPFDAAHAIANIALALVAGPAIVRMLVRFRQRFEWERGGGVPSPSGPPNPPDRKPPRKLRPALKGGGLAIWVVLALLLAALVPSPSQAASGVHGATAWLLKAQNKDGGFGASPEDDSGTEMTAWAMLGLEAAGINPYDVAKGKHTPVTYLRGHVDELSTSGDLSRTILALLGAGADPRDFGGRNLVAALHNLRAKNGSYSGWTNRTAFAVVALRAADSPGGTDDSLEWLRKVQNDDGGWGIEADKRSDAESTGSVLQALSPDSKAAKQGLQYLRESQQSNGGYRLGGNAAINTQATGWAVQGILAMGGDPANFEKGGASPLDYIAENQAANGHYRYSKSSDQTPVWVTGQVLVAVAGKYFPIAASKRAPQTQTSSANGTGGASPPVTTPISPTPEPESIPSSPGSSAADKQRALELLSPGAQNGQGSAGGGSAPGATPGGGDTPESSDGGDSISSEPLPESATSTAAAEASSSGEDGSDGSVIGSIVAGLLAGCLLFGAALLGRKGWMRWRYGL